jgi:hypothetical protein
MLLDDDSSVVPAAVLACLNPPLLSVSYAWLKQAHASVFWFAAWVELVPRGQATLLKAVY